MIAREGARHGFTSASNMYNVSITTAKTYFDDWGNRMDDIKGNVIVAPEVLGIDEAHLGPRISDMRGVFVDVRNAKLLELTLDRSSETVEKVIKSMDGWESIKAITIDMWADYRQTVYKIYGQSGVLIVADHFHVIQDLNRKVKAARKLIAEAAGNPGLGNNHRLMTVDIEDLTNDQKVELMKHFAIVPELRVLYALKESFRSIYNAPSRAEAEEMFERWCKLIPEPLPAPDEDPKSGRKRRGRRKKYVDRFDPIRTFQNSVIKWHKEIFNWFDIQVSNATTEAINGLIKIINRNGRGYSFDTLRHKLLYGLNSNHMPIEKVFESKRDLSNNPAATKYYYAYEINPDVLYLNFVPVYRTREYISDDLSPDIPKLIAAIEDGTLYLGEEEWEDDA